MLKVWQERSMESQSWPVWSRGLRCQWLIWSCQLSHQCKRATVYPLQRPHLIGTRQDLALGDSVWRYVMERKSTLKDCEKQKCEDVLECLLGFWKKKAILSKWETEQLKSFGRQRGSTREGFIPWFSCYLAQRTPGSTFSKGPVTQPAVFAALSWTARTL